MVFLQSNHKKYREALRTSPPPAVPYFGKQFIQTFFSEWIC